MLQAKLYPMEVPLTRPRAGSGTGSGAGSTAGTATLKWNTASAEIKTKSVEKALEPLIQQVRKRNEPS